MNLARRATGFYKLAAGRRYSTMEVLLAPTPAECCGSGCDPCVWDTYYEKLEGLTEQKLVGDEVKIRSDNVSRSGIFEKPQNCVRVRKCDEGNTHSAGEPVTIIKNESFGSLHHMQLQASNKIFSNHAIVYVSPRNEKKIVMSLINRLELCADDVYEIRPNAFSAGIDAPLYPHWIPQELAFSVFEIFSSFTDICGRRSAGHEILNVLSEFCTDENEKHALLHLSSPEGISDYRTNIRARHSNLITLLDEYKSCTPPLARLLSVLPQLCPRPYSSSVVADYQKREKVKSDICDIYFTTQEQGVCTRYLTTIDTNTVCVPEITSPAVRTEGKHVIITMGSGVSYAMAFLRDSSVDKNNIELFHGCRSLDDVPTEVKSHPHLNLSTSSIPRETCTLPKDGSKKYIWGLLWEERSRVLAAVEDPSLLIHVCGSVQMVNDTGEVMKLVLTEAGFEKIKNEKRWIIDTWGAGS